MVSRKVFELVFFVVGSIAALMLTYWALTQHNVIYAFALLGAILFFFWAVIHPPSGLVLLLLQAAFSDELKRLLIVGGALRSTDVIVILAAANLTVLGIVMGLVARSIIEDRKDHGKYLVTIVIGVIVFGIFVLKYKQFGSLVGAAKDTADWGTYIFLVVILPWVLKSRQDVRNFLILSIAIFIIPALKGIHQFFFGFQEYEIQYMLSGLTSMVKLLREEVPRPFGTLNSEHSYSFVMVILCGLAITMALCRRRLQLSNFQLLLVLVGGVSFGGGVAFCLGRTAWVTFALSAFAAFVCLRGYRVVLFYSSVMLAFIVCLIYPRVVYDVKDSIEVMLPTHTPLLARIFTLGTLHERLESFYNLAYDPSYWTFFGHTLSERQRLGDIHIAPIQILVNFGAVGLLGGISVFCYLFVYLHRMILGLPRSWRLLGAGLGGIIIAVWITGLFSGLHIIVFPINLFFWSLVGLLIATGNIAQQEIAESVAEEQQAPMAAVKDRPRLVLTPSGHPVPAGMTRRFGKE